MARRQVIFFIFCLLIVLSLIATACETATPTSAPRAQPTIASAPSPAANQTPGARPAGDATPGARPTGGVPGGQPPTSPVARTTVNRIRATGNLVSANQATLAFQAGGRVKEIKVKEGDQVKAGTLIAAYDTTALDAQITQAQASLDSANTALARVRAGPLPEDVTVAKVNLDRAKAAVDQAQSAYDRIGGSSNPTIGLTSQALNLQQTTLSYQAALAQYSLAINRPTASELKAAEATVAQAQAALETAKVNSSNARIVAPFDGTIISIAIKVGESATTGTSAVTLADLAKMQVQVNVDEVAITSIKVGQRATITTDAALGKTLNGRVSKIGLLATSTNNVVTIPVTLDIDATDAAIYPGLSATVEIVAGQ
ncbi:MAG: efflux RND transporter periplasmic adaptor subunit [Chloroflexi bacterium]|nr:efflux RND transporter periplasmic adaptor subunit [Chloroflexota bacterium]